MQRREDREIAKQTVKHSIEQAKLIGEEIKHGLNFDWSKYDKKEDK